MTRHLANGILFTEEGETGTVPLPPGHRFVAFGRSERPRLMPPKTPGEYEIGIKGVFDAGTLPVLLLAVREEMVPTFLELPAEKLREMINRISAAVAGGGTA